MERQKTFVENSLAHSVMFGPNDYYNLSKYDIEKIYLNRMGQEDEGCVIVEHGVEYSLNKNRYRSPDFVNGTDILFSGCSMTYGVGLSLENTWPHMVSSKLGLSYANIALPGDGVTGQVRQIFSYFKEFGHPKYILALFPNFTRFEFPANDNILTVDKKAHRVKEEVDRVNYFKPKYLYTSNVFSPNMALPISKRPHIADNVFSEELSHFYSAQYILMLKQYCESVGIKFIWGSWEYGMSGIVNKLRTDHEATEYDNFIHLEIDGEHWNFDEENTIDNYLGPECTHDFIVSNPEEYHLALDREYGRPHFGAHRQMHYAEAFLNYIKKD